jgi:hypothetical protein
MPDIVGYFWSGGEALLLGAFFGTYVEDVPVKGALVVKVEGTLASDAIGAAGVSRPGLVNEEPQLAASLVPLLRVPRLERGRRRRP